jgi:hypothetical protein
MTLELLGADGIGESAPESPVEQTEKVEKALSYWAFDGRTLAIPR